MVWQFDGSGFVLHAPCAHPETGFLEPSLVLFVDPVIAVVLLRMIQASANGMQQRPGQNLQRLIAGSLRTTVATIWQRA